jgi:hypothetical protein
MVEPSYEEIQIAPGWFVTVSVRWMWEGVELDLWTGTAWDEEHEDEQRMARGWYREYPRGEWKRERLAEGASTSPTRSCAAFTRSFSCTASPCGGSPG